MESFSNLKAEVSHQTQEMLRETRKAYPVVRSRGKWLGYLDLQGNVCDEKDEWDGTKRDLERYVARWKGQATEIFVELGADGAESVRAFSDFNYDPWVEAADIRVWTSEDGWKF